MAYARIRPRRGTKTEWELLNPVLLEGELAIECPDEGVGTGFCKFKIGDGYTEWDELPYAFCGDEAGGAYGGTVSESHDIQVRSGPTVQWESLDPVLKLGEFGYDTTKDALKIGDGEHNFSELDYIGHTFKDMDCDFGDIDEVDEDLIVDE